jgi:hypothetical protein
MRTLVRRALLPLAVGAALLVAPVAANAATLQQGEWTLDAPGSSTQSYTAQIQQPIDADESSVFSKKRGVIPVQFKVTETKKSSFTFESIGSDGPNTPDNDYSNVVWTPPSTPTPMTVADLNSLVANFTWPVGHSSHGGSLRWSIGTPVGQVHVYYGDTHSWTGTSGSGVNLLAATDDRFDTSGIAGGTFYNTKQQMLDLVGTQPVSWVGLIVDSGWQSDQVLNLSTASVNGGTAFVFPAPVNSSFQTNAPTAKIAVQKYNDNSPDGPIDEALSSAQGDTTGTYRQVDGKYIYNLDTASFNPTQQPGDYKVFLKIDNNIVGTGAFTLK